LLQQTFEYNQIFLKLFQQTYHFVCIPHTLLFWNMINIQNKSFVSKCSCSMMQWRTTNCDESTPRESISYTRHQVHCKT
jgi:hypothetical protein